MSRKPKKTTLQPATPPKTNVIFIIDESGSMSTAANDVRGGFNSYVEKLRGDGNEYSLTAVKFGTTVRPLFANLALADVPQLTTANYMPLDSTALYDAIGYAFTEAQRQWYTEKAPYGEDRVIVIIMTDGEENASREWSKDGVVAEMKLREAAGNWTFVYLGADQDAWAVASHLGFAQGNTLSYVGEATKEVFHSLATATATASCGTATQTRSFFSGNGQ
jgi:uncharacterized protein YegL